MAPLTPFITDHVWNVLRVDDAPVSVHLAEWPVADESQIDEELSRQMALARRLVELGRSARASAVVKIRQPLSRALVAAPGFADLDPDLRAQIADELNVRVIEPLDDAVGELTSYSVKANFRALGRRFGNATPTVAAAIAAADPAELAGQLRSAGQAQLQVGGEATAIGPDDVVVTQVPLSGWAVASASGETVAFEVTITPELRREGLAREFVRLVQEARKADGLAITDRIALRWSTADRELAAALAEYRSMVSAEVLATDFAALPPSEVATGNGDPAADDAVPADDAEPGNDAVTASDARPADADAVPAVVALGRRHLNPELNLTFWIRPISGL